MRVANFSKTEFFFIVFNLWLKILPFGNADFLIFEFLNFSFSQKNNPIKEHENHLENLSKLLKRLFNTNFWAVIWTDLTLYISSWAELLYVFIYSTLNMQYPECLITVSFQDTEGTWIALPRS